MYRFVIHHQIVSIPSKFHVYSLSIGCCIAATEMGSLVIQDAPLLEKCHHAFRETNLINVLHHSSKIFRIIVGLPNCKEPEGYFMIQSMVNKILLPSTNLGRCTFTSGKEMLINPTFQLDPGNLMGWGNRILK